MSDNSGPFSQTREDIEKLIELKFDRFKLQTADSLSRLFSRMLVVFLILVMVGILIAFITIAFAIWIGEMIGSFTLGMLSSSLIVLLIIAFLYIKRDKLFINSMTKLFIKLLFPNDKAE